MQHLCGCPDFGEYTGMVELIPPHFIQRDDDRGICVDVCLALEVSNLWKIGVVTTGSCCGHGRLPPSICVRDDYDNKMLSLGYSRFDGYPGGGVFTAKTQLDIGES